jgi:hypothetical protein
MSIPPLPWVPRYLPAELVCKEGDSDAIAKYKAMSDEEKKKYGGFWWSMHDIIQVMGGLIKEENNANYFNFFVDLSRQELIEAKVLDPGFVATADNQMKSSLNELSNKIRSDFQNQQLSSAAATTAAVSGVAAARPMMMGFPGAPPQGPGMGQDMGMGMGMAPGGPPEPAYSVENLERECFKDISRVPIHSKARVFIVQKDLAPITAAMKERLEKGDFEKIVEGSPTGLNLNEGEPGAMPGAIPGAIPGVTQGGRIIKTRKRKSQNKRKTRRHKRRAQPLKKR